MSTGAIATLEPAQCSCNSYRYQEISRKVIRKSKNPPDACVPLISLNATSTTGYRENRTLTQALLQFVPRTSENIYVKSSIRHPQDEAAVQRRSTFGRCTQAHRSPVTICIDACSSASLHHTTNVAAAAVAAASVYHIPITLHMYRHRENAALHLP